MKRAGKSAVAAKGARRLLPGLAVKDGFTRHPFDVEFGVRTSGLIAGRHLKSGHRHDRHTTAYYGVAPSVFQALVRRWRKSRSGGGGGGDDVCGSWARGWGGRCCWPRVAVSSAAVGVELHPTLARIARKNAALWRAAGRAARRPMRIVMPGCAGVSRCRPVRAWCSCSIHLAPPVMRRLLSGCAKLRPGGRGTGPAVCEQRAGEGAGVAGGVEAALTWGRCGGRRRMRSPTTGYGQPAGGGVCIGEL